MQDLEYQIRFVNCFMNHYNHQYELHVFTDKEQLLEANSKEYAVIITGEYSTKEMAKFVEKGEIVVCLIEDDGTSLDAFEENIVRVEKYQEVYHIAEILERLLVEKISIYHDDSNSDGCRRIGVYSLNQEQYQIPFAALLGKILGANEKVLLIDLQQYSGLYFPEENKSSMGLEDLLSAMVTGNYSRGRLLECVLHEAEWDYVCAVHNNECLAEGSEELYESLIQLMAKELGYQTIILNFGSSFLGQIKMMENCQKVYLLGDKEQVESWREMAFFQQLSRHGRNEDKQYIHKIQIPPGANHENTWRSLVDKWNWSSFGETLRQGLGREAQSGKAV